MVTEKGNIIFDKRGVEMILASPRLGPHLTFWFFFGR